MRIYVFGCSIVYDCWNGAALYYRGTLRALERLGHRIDFCEPETIDRRKGHNPVGDPRYATVRVYDGERERQALQDEAAECADLIVKCSGVGARDRELEEWASGGLEPLTAFWDADAACTLEEIEGDPDHHMRACISRFDLVLTHGGGPPVVDRYRSFGARQVAPIHDGVDPEVHRPVEVDDDLACDAAFMGDRVPEREDRVHRFFLHVAQTMPERTFILGGGGWEVDMLPANVRYIGRVPTARHNALNRSARLVLNIYGEAAAGVGYSPPAGLFEAAAAGACQITDARDGIGEFFEPGREVLVADAPDDVARFIREVDADEARRLGDAARRRAARDHTYGDRAGTVAAALHEAADQRSGRRRRTAGAGAV